MKCTSALNGGGDNGEGQCPKAQCGNQRRVCRLETVFVGKRPRVCVSGRRATGGMRPAAVVLAVGELIVTAAATTPSAHVPGPAAAWQLPAEYTECARARTRVNGEREPEPNKQHHYRRGGRDSFYFCVRRSAVGVQTSFRPCVHAFLCVCVCVCGALRFRVDPFFGVFFNKVLRIVLYV